MNMKKALLLVGSPRGQASTSQALGSYLLNKLESFGYGSETFLAYVVAMTPEKTAAFIEAVRGADLVIFSFPLYVDHLPAPMIKILEAIAVDIVRHPLEKRPALTAVVQSGFPEVIQNRPAVEVVRLFAAQTGMNWLGGLAFGMGGAVNGKPLEKAGGMVRHIIKAFQLAIPSLAESRPVPEEAVRLLEKPMMPPFLYGIAANFSFRRTARKKACQESLRHRPYLEKSF